MKMKYKDINPINNNNQTHGYQEWYWSNGKLWLRCIMKNGLDIGYEENHGERVTIFHIK